MPYFSSNCSYTYFFYFTGHLDKVEGESSGYSYEWRNFLFVCDKGGMFICGGRAMSAYPDIADGITGGIIS
jgi:hypothetical protein